MIDKITNQLNQLSSKELEEVSYFLESEYGVAFSEDNRTHRDEVSEDVMSLMVKTFSWVEENNINATDNFYCLELGSQDICTLVDALEEEFEIEKIEFSKVKEWQRVNDVIDTVMELK